jgi:GTPase Era involved in 16S rRNA processing
LEHSASVGTLVVAGDTGTGETTLLNALLGYELLPTSCCRACTAAVIDASWDAMVPVDQSIRGRGHHWC